VVEFEKITAPLRHAVEAGDMPGIAVAVAGMDGTLCEFACGARDISTGAPMTMDTVLWIASQTKAVTSVCAMQLVEQGKLSLDGDVGKILPELGSVQVLTGFDAEGKPMLRMPRRAMTLRHLLTHTSGYAYGGWNPEILRYTEVMGTPELFSGLSAALALPLIADPGEQWTYGISTDWVGKVIEAVSGKTLGEYMEDNIFRPLGMSDTGFKIHDRQRERLAKVHIRAPNGLQPIDFETPQAPEVQLGGAALYSTVPDYLKFMQMILHDGQFGGEQILKPITVAAMSKSAMGSLTCRALKSAKPTLSADLSFVEGMQWGLGLLINPETTSTGRSAGSLSWAGLANCYYWIDPVQKITGIYAAQLLPFLDQTAMRSFEAFETAVYSHRHGS
jgi:methyl acetate hydrolase